jgi:hypothetical protein
LIVDKSPRLLVRELGRLTTPKDLRKAVPILEEGIVAGARANELHKPMGMALTTFNAGIGKLVGNGEGVDGRKCSSRQVAHCLHEVERRRILLTCSQSEFAS